MLVQVHTVEILTSICSMVNHIWTFHVILEKQHFSHNLWTFRQVLTDFRNNSILVPISKGAMLNLAY